MFSYFQPRISPAYFKKKIIFFFLLLCFAFLQSSICTFTHPSNIASSEISHHIFCIATANGSESNEKLSSSQSDYYTMVRIPFFGDVDAKTYSLPTLAVLLGLLDGFNPCAMWVLVYLISIAMTVNDKRKIWILVGSFVAASGVLYFLFMTAWLNAFLLIGYLRPLTIIIGVFAIGYGLKNIKDFITTKGTGECKIIETETRKKTMTKVQDIVLSPITISSIIGIIGLALVVNSIEFLCSAGFPAIYTYVLSISSIDTLQYYLYIALYILFFMLDDLLIFGAAVFAIKSSPGERYAKYTKPISGAIMILLGTIMTFFPEILR